MRVIFIAMVSIQTIMYHCHVLSVWWWEVWGGEDGAVSVVLGLWGGEDGAVSVVLGWREFVG